MPFKLIKEHFFFYYIVKIIILACIKIIVNTETLGISCFFLKKSKNAKQDIRVCGEVDDWNFSLNDVNQLWFIGIKWRHYLRRVNIYIIFQSGTEIIYISYVSHFVLWIQRDWFGLEFLRWENIIIFVSAFSEAPSSIHLCAKSTEQVIRS